MRKMKIRSILLAAAAVAAAAASLALTRGDVPPLLDATLEQLRHGLDGGSFTSVDLVTAYLGRIAETDHLHAVTEINPDALSIAAQLDDQRRHNASLPALHGIPILVKNNIATADKMNTTAGSYALLGAQVARDATVITRLRSAGAIILGKTNMSQWAASRAISIPRGWSAHGGQTMGAYFPGHDPSGSSSGSAVGTSIGLAFAAIGTETTGSITGPAHMNNVVGIKPTVGLTSRHLVIPFSEHQDTVGPLARTVRDAAHLLTVMAGRDANDNYTLAAPSRTPNYAAACDASALRGKRIGVPRSAIGIYPDVGADAALSSFDAALSVLRAAGATVVDDIALPGLSFLATQDHSLAVLGADLASGLARRYLSQLTHNPHNITSLAALRSFTRACPDEGFPEYKVSMWDDMLALGFGNRSPEFWGNYTRLQHIGGPLGLLGALKNHSLDAVVLPTPYAAVIASFVGAPVVSVPLGFAGKDAPVRKSVFGGLNASAPNQPFGIGFAGAPWQEEKLIAMAYAFEQRTRVRDMGRLLVVPKTEIQV